MGIEKKFKRGDVREDGKIFWRYLAGEKQNWVTPVQYSENQRNSYRAGKLRLEKDRERINALRRDQTKRMSPERRGRYNGYCREVYYPRRKKDPRYLVVSRLRASLKATLRERGHCKRTGRARDKKAVEWLLWLAQHTGIDPKDGRANHIDHLVPLSHLDLSSEEMQSWANSPYNVRWMPGRENLAKADRLPTAIECCQHDQLLAEYYATLDLSPAG